MYRECKVGGILLMGGEGRRFGSGVPKQFHLLGGRSVWQYALETFFDSGLFDEIVLVCHRDWVGEVGGTCVNGARVVEGGKTRQESSHLGLKGFEGRPDIVLVHDAVRPFVSAEILRANVEGAVEHGAVDTCIRTADTLVHAPEGKKILGIPKREEYLRGQTPQTFRREWLEEAHETGTREGIENATDDCRLVLNAGREVWVVEGSEANFKITTEFDLMLAEMWLKSGKWNLKQGSGYAEVLAVEGHEPRK